MNYGVLSSLVVPAVLVSSAALADGKAACLAAVSSAQSLRTAHKLVEAREQLRLCAAAQCPAVVQRDCVPWLAEVEKALPGVVVSAKNGAGADLVDVKVSVDGQLLVTKLDGQALTMNAGAHTFQFETADGTKLDRQVLITEGDKSQPVAVVLGAPVEPGAAGAPTASRPWRTVGWVVGGVGVVGIGLGAVFGIVASADKSSAHCVNDVCDPGTLGGMKSAATGSTVGFIAGGVLLAGGAALVLFAPHATTEATPGSTAAPAATGGIRVVPMVTASGGQILVGGSF